MTHMCAIWVYIENIERSVSHMKKLLSLLIALALLKRNMEKEKNR